MSARLRQAARQALALRTWPAEVMPGWLAPLLFREGDVTAVLQTRRLEKDETRKKLRQQRTVQTEVVSAQQRMGTITDFEAVADLASPTEIAKRLASPQGETLYDVGLALLCRAADQETLDAHVAGIHAHAKDGEAQWQPLDGQGRPDVATLTEQPIRYRRTLDTASLTASSPFLTADIGTPQGPLWGIAAADKAPLYVDLWAWGAAHLVMAGQTNAGKTVTFGHLICEHLTQPDPPDVVILDPVKGDYRRLVKAAGGARISFPSSETVINAFDLPAATVLSGTGEATEQNPVRAQTRLCIGLVALMVCDEGERLRKAERAIVEDAILRAYAGKGITPEAPKSWTRPASEMPVLAGVLRELEAMGASGGAADLATRLRPYCTGTLAGLFSAPTNVPTLARVVSFDLEGIDEDLLPLAIWLIGAYVWKLAKADRRRRVLVLEEVGTLLEHQESARLVAHLYALGRAYGLSVWSTTQLLSEYTATREGERALQNAPTVLLLRQAAGGGKVAQARYDLADDEREWLEAAATGSGLLLTPKGRGRLRVAPSAAVLRLMGAVGQEG